MVRLYLRINIHMFIQMHIHLHIFYIMDKLDKYTIQPLRMQNVRAMPILPQVVSLGKQMVLSLIHI